MSEKLTYADLPGEDKLLIDDLFKYKAAKTEERGIIRNIIAQLKKHDSACTVEIMNLSVGSISDKFDIPLTSARALKKVERRTIEKQVHDKTRSGVQGLGFNQQQKVERSIIRSRAKDESGTFIVPAFSATA